MGAPFLILAAFLAGVLSFSSPCCLPLLPGYVAYVSGNADARQRAGRTMRAAALFTVGFGVTFTALGASASWLGAALLASRPSLVRAAGALVVAVGVLTVAGAEPRVLARERRLVALHRIPRGPLFAAPLGTAFALGWTPLHRPSAGRAACRRGRQPHRGRRCRPARGLHRRAGGAVLAVGLGGRPRSQPRRRCCRAARPPSAAAGPRGRDAAGRHGAGHARRLVDTAVRPAAPLVRPLRLATDLEPDPRIRSAHAYPQSPTRPGHRPPVGRRGATGRLRAIQRSEEHTSELQSPVHLV